MDELISSLRALRDLNPETLFCAHRGRVDDPVAAIDAKMEWLTDLVSQAKGLHSRGLDVAAITHRLLGRERLVRWVSFGEYCERNLIEAALRSQQ